MRTIGLTFVLLLTGCASAPPTDDRSTTIHMSGTEEEIAQYGQFFDQCKAEAEAPAPTDKKGACPVGQHCLKSGKVDGMGGGTVLRERGAKRELSEQCENLKIDVEQPCVAIEQARQNPNRKSFYKLSELTVRCPGS
jgi:hypothetical protein